MRGEDQQQGAMFSYLSPEQRVPQDHPLRAIRAITDPVLQELSGAFDRLYAANGRPSIAPEKLLRALLLQVLYTIRSERLLMEQLDYNLLFRWFVGLNMDEAVWVPTVFSKNRERLLEGDMAGVFFEGVVAKLREKNLLSDEHFTVDGTLLEAWAGAKSFKRKDGKSEPPAEGGSNPTVDFHGEKRSNETHQSATDSDARLAKKGKGKEAKLSYAGHVLMENRNGLIVKTRLTKATGTAECAAALGNAAWNGEKTSMPKKNTAPRRKKQKKSSATGFFQQPARCCRLKRSPKPSKRSVKPAFSAPPTIRNSPTKKTRRPQSTSSYTR